MAKRKRRRNEGLVFPLRQVLTNHGISQRELMRRSGLDYNRINDLYHGRHLPGWATVTRIATCIGADLGEFQPGPEPERPAAAPKKRRRARKALGQTEPMTSEG